MKKLSYKLSGKQAYMVCINFRTLQGKKTLHGTDSQNKESINICMG